MSFFVKSIFGGYYEKFWKRLIEPPRETYSIEELGSTEFSFSDKSYKRTDLTLLSKRKMKLECSHWEPIDQERECDQLPCVIYLHGWCSNRCEATHHIKYLLPKNMTVFAFDFSGCGKSEGKYISMGWYEREDVECVVEYLRKSNRVSAIGLFGRLLGAVTTLMYVDKDPSIAGFVHDFSFCSLKRLVDELVKENIPLPNFMLNYAIELVKSTIKEQGKFVPDEIEPIECSMRCSLPALYCHDVSALDFIKMYHCSELFNAHKGKKELIKYNGGNGFKQPISVRESIAVFFQTIFQSSPIQKEKVIKTSSTKDALILTQLGH